MLCALLLSALLCVMRRLLVAPRREAESYKQLVKKSMMRAVEVSCGGGCICPQFYWGGAQCHFAGLAVARGQRSGQEGRKEEREAQRRRRAKLGSHK